MGQYLGVTAVEEKGEHIGTMRKDQPQIPQDQRLIAIVSNGLWKVAPDVTSSSEYDHFFQSYRKGSWVKIDLFLLHENEIENCPDEGRVYV